MKGPLMALGAVGIGCGVLLAVDPNDPDSLLPKCPLFALTGFQCPACGATRMAHALLHGDLVAAWDFNAVMLVAGLPLLAWFWLRWFAAWRRGEGTPPIPRKIGVPVVVVAATWMLVRNLAA